MAATRARSGRAVFTGIVVLAVFAVSLWVAVTATDGLPWENRSQVRAEFTEVGALRPGDEVRIANVRVGQVKSIQLRGDRALAVLEFEDNRPIYRDASAITASVGARSALGQKFVDFKPGTAKAGPLRPGAVIPAKKTVGAQELSDVLAVLDKPTRQGLGSTLREVGGGAAGHNADARDAIAAAPHLLPDLGTVSHALSADGGADLRAMLSATNSLSERFAGRQHEIGELAGQLDTTLRAVAVDGGGPLDRTLADAPDALRAVRGALGRLRTPLGDTATAMRELEPGAHALGQATPDMRAVLRDSLRPLGKVPGVARQAQPAVDELSTMVSDARPLAPKLTRAFGNLRHPLSVLAPYSPEISQFFTNATDALSGGDEAGHWLRFYPVPGAESVTGALPIQDPTTKRNAYPAPGEAATDKDKAGLLGNREGK